MRATGIMVLGLIVIVGSGSAAAVVQARTESGVAALTLSADSCAATATATYRLPSAARLVSVSDPLVGDLIGGTKADAYPKEDLARINGVEVRGRTLSVSAAAEPDVCHSVQLPGEPADAPWSAAIDADISYLVPDLAWARRQAKEAMRNNLDSVYWSEARVKCQRKGEATFTCGLSTFAGDSGVAANGRVTLDRGEEFAHYRFSVITLDQYCYFVLHKPYRKCRKLRTWR